MTRARSRILLIIPHLGDGGAERVFLTLAAHLNPQLFEVHLGLLDCRGHWLKLLPPHVTVHDLGSVRVSRSAPAILRLVWQLKPDSILATMTHLNHLLIAMRPLFPGKTRLVVRENASTSAAVQFRPVYWKALYRFLYPRADRIVCQSDYMMQDLGENFGVPRERMIRIYNPVDKDELASLSQAARHERRGAGPHLLAVGRLVPEKGFDVLLRALVLVKGQHPDARLTLVGGGPEAAQLQALCGELELDGAVQFTGFQPNPYPYFAGADLFVISSRREALPNALLEAAALGLPILAVACPGGIREIMAGVAGECLVERADPEELAAGILRALRRRFTGPYPFLKEIAVESVIRQYEDMLLHLPRRG